MKKTSELVNLEMSVVEQSGKTPKQSLDEPKRVHRFKCPVPTCNSSVRWVYQHLYYYHHYSKDDSTPAQCHICSQSFKNILQMARHIDRDHVPTYEGDDVKDSTMANSETKLEPETKDPEDTVEINYDDDSADSDEDTFSEEKLTCDKCNRAFSSDRSLNYHVRVHHERKQRIRNVCHYCQETFGVFELRDHIKEKHQVNGEYICGPCNLTFKRGNLWNQHGARVHANINYDAERDKTHESEVLNGKIEHETSKAYDQFL